MGKKSEKPTEEAASVAKKPVAVKKPAKSSEKKSETAGKASSGSKKSPLTHEQIEKQAYFVSQRRHAAGLPGSAAGDWAQAEKELLEAQK